MTSGPPTTVLILFGAAIAAGFGGVALAWHVRRNTMLSARNFYLAAIGVLLVMVAVAQVSVVVAAGISPVLVFVLSASAFGRRWRLSDLGAGEELKTHEERRRWFWEAGEPPVTGERTTVQAQGEVFRERRWPAHEPYVPLTADEADEHTRVPRANGRHLFVVGGTGSGKTTSALRAAAGRVLHDRTALVAIDQKGDPPTEAAMRALAAATGRPFILFDPREKDTDRWMPLWGDYPAETVARLVAGIRTSEPYYHDALRQHLTIVVNVLHATGHWPVSFPFVVSAAQLGRFARVYQAADALQVSHPTLYEQVEEHARFVTSRTGENAVSGGLMRLALVADAWSGVMAPRELEDGSRVGVAMPEAIKAGALILFRTHVDAMKDAAEAMTALALGDVAAAAQVADAPWTLLADEVGGVMEMAAEPALALLQRGRTHQGQVLFITQSVADIEALTGQAGLLDSLSDNFAGFIVHRQTAPDSRDWLAKLMGTKALWQATDQTIAGGAATSGTGTRRRVREFLIPADTFQTLSIGQAVNYTTMGPRPKVVRVRALAMEAPADVPRLPADVIGAGEIPVKRERELPPTPLERAGGHPEVPDEVADLDTPGAPADLDAADVPEDGPDYTDEDPEFEDEGQVLDLTDEPDDPLFDEDELDDDGAPIPTAGEPDDEEPDEPDGEHDAPAPPPIARRVSTRDVFGI